MEKSILLRSVNVSQATESEETTRRHPRLVERMLDDGNERREDGDETK
jgi:hypothetical protein